MALVPGLYEFTYTKEGKLTGLTLLTKFPVK